MLKIVNNINKGDQLKVEELEYADGYHFDPQPKKMNIGGRIICTVTAYEADHEKEKIDKLIKKYTLNNIYVVYRYADRFTDELFEALAKSTYPYLVVKNEKVILLPFDFITKEAQKEANELIKKMIDCLIILKGNKSVDTVKDIKSIDTGEVG